MSKGKLNNRHEIKTVEDLTLYRVAQHIIPIEVIKKRNKTYQWDYGYNDEYDVVIISQDGTIGEIYEINGLLIALPLVIPKLPVAFNKWVAFVNPKELMSIRSMADWNKRDNTFKAKWIDYIEEEFVRRENGYWFTNNGVPTYITGSHYMYLQWSKIDVGLPEFRESLRSIANILEVIYGNNPQN